MGLVAGLDFGGGAVKACVADIETGALVAIAQQATPTHRPGPGRAEFDPASWWSAAGTAMRAAVASADRVAADYSAVSATSLRQAYVLLDAGGEMPPGVLNSDRRGADQLDRQRAEVGTERLYEQTGHWPAPELTLPRLMHERENDAERWERAVSVLFVHDWCVWKLSGERLSEPSMASAGQMLDIERGDWAKGLLDTLGIGADLLPPLVAAGTEIGRLRDDSLGLPLGLPVVVGGSDTQMAAAGSGGLAAGVVSIVAGTTTPLQATTASIPRDRERHPWVSTHVESGRWAVETNAGYAGMNLEWLASMTQRSVVELADEAASSQPGAEGITALVASPVWSESRWSGRPLPSLLGFEPRHQRGDVARAFIEAHAYAIRANLEDLERAIGQRSDHIDLLGGAGRVHAFAQLVSDVIGRPVRQVGNAYPPAAAFAWLVRRAQGEATPPAFEGTILEPADHAAFADGYGRFRAADDVMNTNSVALT
jgi:sugar (pentulose or hexulose) kinase